MSRDIFVIVEHFEGRVADVSFEMLGKARELAGAAGSRVVAVAVGHALEGVLAELGAADAVLVCRDPSLARYTPEAYQRALAAIIGPRRPRLTLVANTAMGMDLAAGLSGELGWPLCAYCRDVRFDGDRLLATSQIYGGKILAEAEVESDTALVSMLAGACPAEAGRAPASPAVPSSVPRSPQLSAAEAGRAVGKPAVGVRKEDEQPSSAWPEAGRAAGSPAVEEIPPRAARPPRVRFRRLIRPEAGDVDITRERVLVSVGRGIQSKDNIAVVDELAAALGGTVSASRPIVDQGWLPKTRQVGKSGMSVKPRLYIAVGISGAPEHLEGMRGAELIVAVNTDTNAPIFDVAHYGVVADLFDVIPLLTEKIRAAKQG